MEAKEQEIFDQIPKPDAGAVFELSEVCKISWPHPFCITPRHVTYAADRCGGMLTEVAIKDSRAPCGVRNCQLGYDEHKSQMTLFITVPDNRNLNAIDGLHAYLMAIKDKATELGIDGFAFPNRKRVS